MPNASAYTSAVNAACASIAASGGSVRLHDLHDHLNQLAHASPEDAAWKHLAEACAYRLGVPVTSDAGGPYTPDLELRDGEQWLIYPPHLETRDDNVLATWQLCAEDDDLHAMVRARLADLLWTRDVTRPPLWHKIAVDSYLASAGDPQLEMADREAGLRRAVQIATETNQDTADALTALANLAGEALTAPKQRPGVVIGSIKTLAANGYDCDPLIEAAAQTYSGDPHLRAAVAAVATLVAGGPAERERHQREQIAAFETEADRAAGLRRVHFLNEAREVAVAAKLGDEARRLTALIEGTDTAADWRTIEVSAEIDSAALDEWIAVVVGDDSLSAALSRFGYATPIRGTDGSESLAVALGSLSLFDEHGGVTTYPAGDKHRAQIAAGQADEGDIDAFVQCLGLRTLRSLHERYGPDEAQIAATFSCGAVPEQLALRIAVSYCRWAAGDYTSAVAVIFPTVEALTRAVCVAVGSPATTPTRDTGNLRRLPDLLAELAPWMGEARSRYLRSALTDRFSLQLRHKLAHGLGAYSEAEYVVLFHIVCLLALTCATGPWCACTQP